jgi:hypothetical protein
MTKREKMLAGTVGLMVFAMFGSSLLTRYRDTVEENRTLLRDIEQQLSQARTAKLRGQRAVTKLRRWQKQSLPTNPDIANSLYEDWLQKKLTEAGLKVNDIKSSTSLRGANDRTQEFRYIVAATGEASALVKFLASFYKAGHLQRISQASLTPAKEGGGLAISMTVDALSMRDSPRADKLSELDSNAALPSVEELQAAISKRNLFSASPEKKPDAMAARHQPNEADQAFVSSMTQGESGWQMSVRLGDSGRMLYFRAGDAIQIGTFKAKVSEINGRRVIVEKDGSPMQVFLGQNLGQAQPFAKSPVVPAG